MYSDVSTLFDDGTLLAVVDFIFDNDENCDKVLPANWVTEASVIVSSLIVDVQSSTKYDTFCLLGFSIFCRISFIYILREIAYNVKKFEYLNDIVIYIY